MGRRRRLNEWQIERAKADQLLKELGIETHAQFRVAVVYGNHGLPSVGDLDVSSSDDPLELANAIEKEVPSYNDFKGRLVAQAIRDLHNSGLISSVSFGREASPVLYVEVPYWTGQASNLDRLGEDWDKAHGESRKYTDQERGSMFNKIIDRLRETVPDELGWQKAADHGSYETDRLTGTAREQPYKVRAWWD